MASMRCGGQVGGHVQVLARFDLINLAQALHDALYHHGVDSSRHSEGQCTWGSRPERYIRGLATSGFGTASSALAPPNRKIMAATSRDMFAAFAILMAAEVRPHLR